MVTAGPLSQQFILFLFEWFMSGIDIIAAHGIYGLTYTGQAFNSISIWILTSRRWLWHYSFSFQTEQLGAFPLEGEI